MQTIDIEDIVVPEYRQRREFDPDLLQSLQDSIFTRGLMHAIVLRKVPNAEGVHEYRLVAGERRLRAIKEGAFLNRALTFNGSLVESGKIPFVEITALSDLEAEEAELEENTVRADLTWQEKASAIARLDSLRRKQATARGETWERSDTAVEIVGTKSGRQATEITQSIAVVKALEQLKDTPAAKEAAKATTVKEAFKILKREENRQGFAAQAAEIQKVQASTKHRLIQASCIEELSKPEYEAYFDIILSDPPYGMNADQFGDSGSADRTQGAHQYDDSYESWLTLMQDFVPLTVRVTKPQSHMYLFCDFDRFHQLKQMCEIAGWTVFRTPLVMQKAGQSGRVPLPNHGPRRQYELVLYAFRGQRQVRAILPDVFVSPQIPERIGHPAEKHTDAIRNLLQRSAFPGDRVLDPFCGSGPILPAGEAESCFVTAIELSETFTGMAASRLKELDK